MERIVRGRSATLTHTFYSAATATDPSPDTATVTITRADGTALVTAASATEAGVGVVTYTVTPAQTALLDTWTVTWTATFGGQSQSFIDTVEVAGDVLFTLAEIRAVTPINDTVNYLTADILDVRTTVEQAIEQACGVAFVPRYALERYSGDGSNALQLRHVLPSSIRSVTITGTAFTAPQLADLTMAPGGAIYSTLTYFTWGQNNIVAGYEHGYQDAPMEIRRAALALAKMWLVGRRNPIDDRAITFNAGADGGTYSLAVPGRAGSSFGHPDIDVAVDRYSRVSLIA
jgi:hypothetical protein